MNNLRKLCGLLNKPTCCNSLVFVNNQGCHSLVMKNFNITIRQHTKLSSTYEFDTNKCRSTRSVDYPSTGSRILSTTSPYSCKTSLIKLETRYYCSQADEESDISYEELVTLVDSDSVQLIDVREPDELERYGSYPNALNIPLGQLADALSSSPQTFKALYGTEQPDLEDNNIVFSCFLGIRSAKALYIAHELGYSKARHYSGGFKEWLKRQSSS